MKKIILSTFCLAVLVIGTSVSASTVDPSGSPHPCMNGPCLDN